MEDEFDYLVPMRL